MLNRELFTGRQLYDDFLGWRRRFRRQWRLRWQRRLRARILRLWFDRNHNGVSEPEELVSLADAGVLAISSEYKENARRDQYGNKFSLMGKALFRGPQGQETWRTIYDVYLTVVGSSTR